MSFLFFGFSFVGLILPCRLNMRTTIAIYNNLYAYLTHQDSLAAAAVASSSPPASSASPTAPTSPSTTIAIDTSIDPHFRSGVYLGVGMCNIILSMMPGKLMTLVELFGYHGDRKLGLSLLEKAGGWECVGRFFILCCFSPTFFLSLRLTHPSRVSLDANENGDPSISPQEEGIRRSICDMSLLLFHLVLSSFTFDGVDVKLAGRVLEWNLRRYPNGEFLSFFGFYWGFYVFFL